MQKRRYATKKISVSLNYYGLLSYIFLESRCTRFIESEVKFLLEVKNLLNLRFLNYFSKAETEECL